MAFDPATLARYEFTSDESFDMHSRKAKVWNITPDQRPAEIWDPRDLTGLSVLLNGEPVRVLAVETFAIHRTEENPYRLSFGLLIANEQPCWGDKEYGPCSKMHGHDGPHYLYRP
jgi:hypothetical protein